jgi:hypothetical protein
MSGTFLRFTVPGRRHPDSLCDVGPFQVAYGLRGAGLLEDHELLWFEEVMGWFDDHLVAPQDGPGAWTWTSGRHARAIFWFKSDAREAIQRMRLLLCMLRHHGIALRLLRTRRPGHVVYEDAHQVGAIPHRDGVARRRSGGRRSTGPRR